jgi:hypothetical protein
MTPPPSPPLTQPAVHVSPPPPNDTAAHAVICPFIDDTPPPDFCEAPINSPKPPPKDLPTAPSKKVRTGLCKVCKKLLHHSLIHLEEREPTANLAK